MIMDKIQELKHQIDKNEKEIHRIEWKETKKRIYERGLKGVGGFWRFYQGYKWYIYAEVVDCIRDDDSIYAILNTYEETPNGQVTLKVNYRSLEVTSWMHCWDSIRKEEFLEEKSRILKKAKLKNLS